MICDLRHIRWCRPRLKRQRLALNCFFTVISTTLYATGTCDLVFFLPRGLVWNLNSKSEPHLRPSSFHTKKYPSSRVYRPVSPPPGAGGFSVFFSFLLLSFSLFTTGRQNATRTNVVQVDSSRLLLSLPLGPIIFIISLSISRLSKAHHVLCASPPQSVWFPSVHDAHYVFLLSLSTRYRARIDGPSDPRSPTIHSLLTSSAPHSPGRKRRVYGGSVSTTVVLLLIRFKPPPDLGYLFHAPSNNTAVEQCPPSSSSQTIGSGLPKAVILAIFAAARTSLMQCTTPLNYSLF